MSAGNLVKANMLGNPQTHFINTLMLVGVTERECSSQARAKYVCRNAKYNQQVQPQVLDNVSQWSEWQYKVVLFKASRYKSFYRIGPWHGP